MWLEVGGQQEWEEKGHLNRRPGPGRGQGSALGRGGGDGGTGEGRHHCTRSPLAVCHPLCHVQNVLKNFTFDCKTAFPT